MSALSIFLLALVACEKLAAASSEKPTSFCYATIGPGIQSRLHLHNASGGHSAGIVIRVQTLAGNALAPAVTRELKAGEDYEAAFGPAASVQQIWALLTVSGAPPKGAISMHSDGPVEGAFGTEKTDGASVKTRTNTLTPILVQDPGDRPRGIEPNKSVLRLGSFFTGEYAFVGNPRERPLDVSFCAPRTGQCWQWRLGARAAISVSLAEFKAALGIANMDEYVACRFGGATAFCNMRNAGADSAITFGEPHQK